MSIFQPPSIDPLLARSEISRRLQPPPAENPSEQPDVPRSLKRVRPSEVLEAVGSFFAALVLGLTLCWFLSWRGLLGPGLIVALLFVGVFSVVVRESSGAEAAADRVANVLIAVTAITAVLPLVAMVGFVTVKGVTALRPGFFFQDMAKVGPLNKGGGGLHAIIGTLEQVGIASVVAIPLAFLSAVYLNEMKGRLAGYVRFIVDAMSGVPSILAGLFVYAAWVVGLKQGYSGFAGSLALIVLMLPTVTRTSEEVLRTISDNLREASLALGAAQWRTVLGVVLPTARSGLITATLLGVARAVGETAPMLMTARGSSATNVNPLKNQQSDLPLFIVQLLKQPNKAQADRAYTGALILMLMVGLLFTLARLVGTSRRK
jgi:phosphate transport system permease protein